jgi:hypothetical protein
MLLTLRISSRVRLECSVIDVWSRNWAVRRFVPIIGWFPEYKWSEFRFDLIAGIAVSALVVPKALGYAGIARVPVETGCMQRSRGASSTRCSARHARSRPGRVRRSRR